MSADTSISIHRVVMGMKPFDSPTGKACGAIHAYKKWLTEQGIPIEALLSGEMVAVTARWHALSVELAARYPNHPMMQATLHEVAPSVDDQGRAGTAESKLNYEGGQIIKP